MTSARQLRNVLREDTRHVIIEELPDGSAMVRDDPGHARRVRLADRRTFPVTDTLSRCADRLSEAGFMVALVRDERGVYLNAH